MNPEQSLPSRQRLIHPLLAQISLLALCLIALAGCNDSNGSITGISTTPTTTTSTTLNPAFFLSGSLAEAITTEDCTLSGGTQTTCYRITIKGVPSDSDVGPFCPPTIQSTAAEGGIWFDGGGQVYNIDGDFIVNLPNLYADSHWQLYDLTTGKVNVTDTQAACEGAARPDVEEQYQNHCVQCSLEYVDGGVTQTFLIPTTPVPLANTSSVQTGDVGLTLNGVVLAAAAPVDAILSAYTIAAFDDCGGHINPVAGYHYHASTGCTEVGKQADGHAALIGYAMDGYGIYGMLDTEGNEHNVLDACRGATDSVRGYHYHAASPGENMFIGCFHGEQGSVEGATDAGGPPTGGPPTGGIQG